MERMVAFSGFTPAGAAKAVPRRLAGKARTLHQAGLPYKLRSADRRFDRLDHRRCAGRGAKPSVGGRLSNRSRRSAEANQCRTKLNLSTCICRICRNRCCLDFLAKIDFAVIEATEITPDGRVYLTTSIGASPTFLQTAEKVIIEINRRQSPRISEMADIIIPEPPPYRMSLDLDHPLERIGKTYARRRSRPCGWHRRNRRAGRNSRISLPAAISCKAIAGHVVKFLTNELASGRMPHEFLPIAKRRGQCGQCRAGRHWRKSGHSQLFNV